VAVRLHGYASGLFRRGGCEGLPRTNDFCDDCALDPLIFERSRLPQAAFEALGALFPAGSEAVRYGRLVKLGTWALEARDHARAKT